MFFIYLIVLLYLTLINASELPPGVEKCARNGSNLVQCSSNAVYNIKKYLVNGMEDKGIDSIDPMSIDHFEINEQEGSQNRLFNLNQKFQNVQVTGFGDFTIKDLKIDFNKKCKIQAKAHMPRMEIYGDYQVNGNLMVFTIRGKGKANLTFTDIPLRLQILCNFMKNHDKNDILNIKSMAFVLNPKFVHFDFENLFDGNRELSATLSTFLNDNSLTIFDELKSGYQNIFNQRFLKLSNQFLKDIPTNELFSTN